MRLHPAPLAHVPPERFGLVVAAVALLALLATAGSTAGARRPRSVGPSVHALMTPVGVVLGSLATVVAVSPPLERATATSFGAHMTQHLLLVAVAAPLLAAVRLHHLVAVGAGLRRSPRWRAASAVVRETFALHRHPVAHVAAATVASVTVLLAWHVPALWEAAGQSAWVHGLEHAAMLGTAYWFWAVMLRRRTPAGAALLAIVVSAIAHGLLGAVLTFSPRPLYPSYAATSAGASDLADQQLAGLLMWVPGGAVHLVAAAAVTVAAIGRAERRMELREQRGRPGRDEAVAST